MAVQRRLPTGAQDTILPHKARPKSTLSPNRMTIDQQLTYIRKGMAEIIREEDLRERLVAAEKLHRPLRIKILDPQKTEVRFNSHWLEPLKYMDMIGLFSKYTVARILERDDFAKRYKEGVPISLHELMYPLAQAYDYATLECDVEMGGTDQKFNLLVGRELQKDFGQPQQIVGTVPILEGLDGVKKMSKSLGNYIGITEPPGDMFRKVMQISDSLMFRRSEEHTSELQSLRH